MSTPEPPVQPGGDEPQQPQSAQPPQAPQPPQTPQSPQAPQPPQYGTPQQAQYGAPQGGPQPQYGAPQGAPQPTYAGAAGVPGPGEPFDGASNAEDLSRPLYGASFGQAIRRFFKNYVNFTGRASRSEFWWIALFNFLVGLIPGIFVMIGTSLITAATASSVSLDPATGEVVINEATAGAGSGFGVFMLVIGWILSIAIGLALLLPGLGLAWRRLHDANLAGPFYFLALIPWVGGIVLLILMLMPSKPEGRRFVSNK